MAGSLNSGARVAWAREMHDWVVNTRQAGMRGWQGNVNLDLVIQLDAALHGKGSNQDGWWHFECNAVGNSSWKSFAGRFRSSVKAPEPRKLERIEVRLDPSNVDEAQQWYVCYVKDNNFLKRSQVEAYGASRANAELPKNIPAEDIRVLIDSGVLPLQSHAELLQRNAARGMAPQGRAHAMPAPRARNLLLPVPIQQQQLDQPRQHNQVQAPQPQPQALQATVAAATPRPVFAGATGKERNDARAQAGVAKRGRPAGGKNRPRANKQVTARTPTPPRALGERLAAVAVPRQGVPIATPPAPEMTVPPPQLALQQDPELPHDFSAGEELCYTPLFGEMNEENFLLPTDQAYLNQQPVDLGAATQSGSLFGDVSGGEEQTQVPVPISLEGQDLNEQPWDHATAPNVDSMGDGVMDGEQQARWVEFLAEIDDWFAKEVDGKAE